MLNQSDVDIIDFLEGKDRIEVRTLFKYLTGDKTYDQNIEDDLREMLRFYGYRLRRQCIDRTRNTWGGNLLRCSYTDTSTWYYSISQYGRIGCYPCGIKEKNEWMSRCYHWQKCHYGISGRCQLAQITMN